MGDERSSFVSVFVRQVPDKLLCIEMTNDEGRQNDEARMTKEARFRLRHLSLIRISSFVFRH
jgi:hypothetical protein